MKFTRAKAEMREQMQGILISLCGFLLALVWVIDSPRPLRYGITALVVLIVVYSFILASIRTVRTRRKRALHLAQHAARLEQEKHS